MIKNTVQILLGGYDRISLYVILPTFAPKVYFLIDDYLDCWLDVIDISKLTEPGRQMGSLPEWNCHTYKKRKKWNEMHT